MPPGKGARKVYTVETDPKGGWRGKAKGSPRAVAKGDNKEPEKVNDHGCLLAGTSVATDRGAVPIEQVRSGDRVWTRQGLRQVLASGMTQDEAFVFEVSLGDGGRRLTGTGDHPVWVIGLGWRKLDTLRYGDRSHGGAHVLSVSALPDRQPVFNLTVEGEPEFYANGILVHNCDAMPSVVAHFDLGVRPEPRLAMRTPCPNCGSLSRKFEASARLSVSGRGGVVVSPPTIAGTAGPPTALT